VDVSILIILGDRNGSTVKMCAGSLGLLCDLASHIVAAIFIALLLHEDGLVRFGTLCISCSCYKHRESEVKHNFNVLLLRCFYSHSVS